MLTFELGPEYNGRSASLIRKYSADGKTLWSIEDREIAAGKTARFGDIFIVAGSRWDGKQTPVLRRVSESGMVLWQTELKSRFESAEVRSLLVEESGVLVIVGPFSVTPDD